jgi:hypothetical protein
MRKRIRAIMPSMHRRLFLALLTLPFVTPAARVAQRLIDRARRPVWWASFDLEVDRPIYVDVTADGITRRRVVLPPRRGRATYWVPMWSPRPTTCLIKMRSAGPPFRVYGASVTR